MLHSFLSLSTFAALAAAVVVPLEERQEQTCSSLHLMVAGGCALPCQTDSPGLLSTTISNITTAIPNTDVYLVPYDGNPFQAAVSTPLMIQAANQYAAACPNTPIVFLGYSLGGIIVTNTLCGGIGYNPNVIASITYGEETRVYPASYDRGSCEQSAPKYPRSNPGACDPFAPIMQSYCDYGDPQCCKGGFIPAQHFGYAAKYDLAALAFVESQYEAFTNTNLSQTTTPSVTTSAVTTGNVQPIETVTTSTGLATTSTITTTTYSSLRYSNSSLTVSSADSSTVVPVVGQSTGTPTAASAVSSGPLLTHYTTTETTIGGTASTITILVPVRTTTTIIPTYSPTGLTTPSIPTTGSLTSGLIPLTGVVVPTSIPSSLQYLTSSNVQGIEIGATTATAESSATVSTVPYAVDTTASSAEGTTAPTATAESSATVSTVPYAVNTTASSAEGTTAPTAVGTTTPGSATTGLAPFAGSASSLANPAILMISCVVLAWRLLI